MHCEVAASLPVSAGSPIRQVRALPAQCAHCGTSESLSRWTSAIIINLKFKLKLVPVFGPAVLVVVDRRTTEPT